jgi:mannose-1-phosphate guanylyltransferase
MVTSVEDPSKYGIVIADDEQVGGKVSRFIEKPKEFITNRINAGLYIFNTSILDKIELRPHFLERDIFPKLAE